VPTTAALLKQALANLIDNTIKYSRLRESENIHIGCGGEEAGGAVLRSISRWSRRAMNSAHSPRVTA
jgi:signal transduction histidine kinase